MPRVLCFSVVWWFADASLIAIILVDSHFVPYGRVLSLLLHHHNTFTRDKSKIYKFLSHLLLYFITETRDISYVRLSRDFIVVRANFVRESEFCASEPRNRVGNFLQSFKTLILTPQLLCWLHNTFMYNVFTFVATFYIYLATSEAILIYKHCSVVWQLHSIFCRWKSTVLKSTFSDPAFYEYCYKPLSY